MTTLNQKESFSEMDKKYDEDLKKMLVEQYYLRREEYEQSIEVELKTIDDGGVEVRSGKNLRLESVLYDVSCRKKHHTDKFEVGDGKTSTPIYRRGDSFKMKLRLNRRYNRRNDSIFMVVSFGPNASINNGTKYNLPMLPSRPLRNMDQWAIWIDDISGNTITVEVFSPASCLVGIWRCQFSISSLNPPQYETTSAESILYILFNPWCQDDEVYIKDEALRQAYVITDYGNIFQGTYKEPTPKQWVYGQFDFSVLPSVCLLLDRSSYPSHVRGSAAYIVRALSAMVNSNDDNGLLVGNWSGHFSGGRNPDNWTGSVSIFDKFLSDGGNQPVKYAQCWVYAGCLTTACRALGIPCRTVTCFMSGHDGDGSLTICYYYDENGKQLSMINSIWNYHVWNEAWIERKDLPAEYSGWQAADATPQERSKGMFRAGPAPVKAVYNADLGLKYDIPFVYAEVNSDICHFQKDQKSPLGFKLIQRIVNEVGNLIVTESAIPEYAEGEATMEILTGNYKASEGSDMERHNFYRAVNQMPKSQALYEQIGPMPKDKQDVNFTITHIKSIVFGEKFDIALSFKNYSSKKRTVEFNVGVHASLYTGSLIASLKEEHLNINLQPKEIKEVKVAMIADDYKGKLGSASHIKVAVTGMVEETDQLLTAYDTFEVIRPKLEIQVQDYIELGSPFFVTFFFKNPFSTELTNCTLTVEAGKVRRPSVIEISNLPVNGAMEKTIQLMPKHVGKNVIVGVLKSDHPISISGSTYIDIQY